MAKTIGAASDFYRLRVVRVDVSDDVDLEWRDDILYRRTAASEFVQEPESYIVEAVLLDNDEIAVALGSFEDSQSAHVWMDDRVEEMDDMTRSEFESIFFPEPDEE